MSLPEERWPPRKDFVATYAKYGMMRLCAETELLMLLEKRKCVGPTTPNRTRDALEIDIARAKAYLAALDSVMAKFAKALCMLSRIHCRQDYALFARLIIECGDPKTVASEMHLSVKYVQNARSRFKLEIARCLH